MTIYPVGNNMVIFMAKPDAVRRNLINVIRQELKNAKFYVIAEKEKILTVEEIKTLYESSFRRDYPKGENDKRAYRHIKFMQSGPVHSFLVSHAFINKPELFELTKQLRGNHWLSYKCNHGSIRYKLRNTDFDGLEPVFQNGFLITPYPENVIHATINEYELQKAFSVYFNDIVKVTNHRSNLEKVNSTKRFIYDILFVITYNNSSSSKINIKMHNGVSHLISFLKQKGFSVGLEGFADLNPKEIACEIAKISSRVVGFSTVSSEFSQVAEISDYLKKMIPETYLVGGGVHFSINPQDLLATSLDSVVIGEGEFALEELLNNRSIKDIPGMAYRHVESLHINPVKNYINDISSLPPADHHIWDKYPEQKDYSHRRVLLSRGCPFTCSYCSNKELSKIGKGIYTRFRSPKSIESEISFIKNNYENVKTIFLESECFHPAFADTKGILRITNKYKDSYKFGTNIRIGSFDIELINKLFENGVTFANMGIESGSERIRREVLNRHYTNEQVVRLFEEARIIGLKLNTYNLLGLPTETKKDFEETIELNLKIKPATAQVAIFQPYPGTLLYYKCLDWGILDNPFYHHYYHGKERRESILKMPQFPPEEIQNMYKYFNSIFVEGNV